MSDGPNRVINFAKFRYVKNDPFDQMKCRIRRKQTIML